MFLWYMGLFGQTWILCFLVYWSQIDMISNSFILWWILVYLLMVKVASSFNVVLGIVEEIIERKGYSFLVLRYRGLIVPAFVWALRNYFVLDGLSLIIFDSVL